MLHQGSESWAGTKRSGLNAAERAPNSITALAYRSRPLVTPSRVELDDILRIARDRNHVEGLTGLLIYDRGYFYQWLEGPKLSLARVWDSIRCDPRHHDIKVIRQETMRGRFFSGWDMRLARRTRGDIDRVLTVMEAPQELLARLRIQPSVMPSGEWDQLFTDVVIPRLRTIHPAAYSDPRLLAPQALWAARRAPPLWHAHREAGAELASLLLEVDTAATARFVDALIDQGAGLEPLYHQVFEPAARCLGGLWDDDTCGELALTLAIGRLQVQARRLGAAIPRAAEGAQPGHAILLAQQPGELHGLSGTLSSELFLRDGWDVSQEFPRDDDVLRHLVHEQWFDVLELSQSTALRRDQRLPALRFTIGAARAASLNPGLAIIVDGRSFFERPQAYLDVGADLGCASATDSVPAAQFLLDALASRSDVVARPLAAVRSMHMNLAAPAVLGRARAQSKSSKRGHG